MGWDVKIKTDDIFNAYLILGILEINKEELNNNSRLTQSDMLKILGIDRERNYIGRYLDKVELWLGNVGFTQDQIDLLIERDRRGFTLRNDIPLDSYKDYLGTFLFLNLIEDNEHKNNLDSLIRKEGERPFSIITKLYLAKKNRVNLNIEYDEPESIINFRPTKFSLDQNDWIVIGKSNNQPSRLEIKKIIKIVGFDLR